MATQKVSIHRALSELKLLDAKISKKMEGTRSVGLMQKDKLVNQFYTEEHFKATANSDYQSIIDLIERKVGIKKAIVAANAETIVKIADKEMTIADAITYKSVVQYKKQLLELLESQLRSVKTQVEQNNAKIENAAIDLAKVALSKSDVALGDKDVEKVVGPYLESHLYSIVDPLKIEEKIAELSKEINEFEAEVDSILSETNAVTLIEI